MCLYLGKSNETRFSKMKTLQVHLLGNFSLSYDDIPLTSLNTPRLQALFAFLILHRNEPQSRQHLSFQFWPDSTEAQARTNLRNLIHLLHQALPDFDRFIRTDPHTIQWIPEAPFTLDSLEFERSLTTQPGDSLNREQLESAVDHYDGDLLPSCYEDWIVPERERLRRAYLAALEALATITEEMRDYPAALEYTRRLVQAEPTHGPANHQLIRRYALVGNRPAALKAYQNYAHHLSNELGVQPDPETQDLYQALLAHKIQESDRKQLQSLTSALVGRQQEWQRLLSTWKRSSAGNPHMIFICGEAGIGKSRLVEEMVDWANRQDIHTAVAHCYPTEGSLPYSPIVAWLRALPILPLEELWLTEISRLLPETHTWRPQLPKPGPLTEAWQRQRLFEALARGILGNRKKLLLVIEDLHWCDQDTLDWLNYLIHFAAKAPVLILASVRFEEMAASHPIQNFQTTLTSAGMSSLIELKPLDQAESFQLANQVSLQVSQFPLDPDTAQQIFKQTEGNPLFIVETLRLGNPSLADGSILVQDAPLSEKAQAVLRHRIAQLSPQTREIACLAATIGRQFSLDVLRQVSGIGEEELVSHLDELLLRRIIREDSPDQYDFSHDKLRETTFTGLSTAHRRLLHRKVAEAYVEISTRQGEARYAEIAGHYEHAGLILPAIDYYRQAANAAAKLFANAEAIHYLQHALALANTLNPGSPHAAITYQDQALLYENLGDVLALTGSYAQALDSFTNALNLPFDQTPIWKSSLYRKINTVQIPLYRHPDAHISLDLAERCLGEEPTQPVRQEWINVQLARGQLFYWENNLSAMNQALLKVQPVIDEYGSDEQRLELLSISYQYRLRLERYQLSPTTIDLARRRRELCLASGDRSKLTYANFQLGFALLWGGETAQAQEYLETALGSAETMGARTVQGRCLTYLSITNRKLKQIEALHSQTEDLLKLTEAIGDYAYQGVAWANKAWLAWRDGNEDQTEEYSQEALNCWRKYPGAYVFHWLALWPMLAVSVAQGRLEQAELYAGKMLDPEQQPLPEPLPQLLENALHARKAGDDASAITSFQQALEAAKAAGDL